MMKIRPFPSVAAALVCSMLFSCKKQDHVEDLTNREPPKMQVFSTYSVVGSDIDSFELKSIPTYNYEPGELPYAPKWETEWTCTSKPAGAADPLIMQKNAQTAYATNLAPGIYRFEVSYRTKVSTRKGFIEVKVVQAKPSGTSIISDRVNWQISDGQDWVEAWTLYGTMPSDPEVFYFSGILKAPRVEYMDPISNQWKQLAQSSEDSALVANGRASIDFRNNSLSIHVWNGITPDLLPVIIAKPPAVRITFP